MTADPPFERFLPISKRAPDAAKRSSVVFLQITAILAFLVISWLPARAAELEMLARILIPAYMAQNFAALCVVESPSFVEDSAGSRGHVHVYAKHVRDEVSIGLSRPDVETVFRIAADTARSVVRKELADLSSGVISPGPEPLARWCEKSAKPFVREIMETHFLQHSEIERMMDTAKRS